MILIYSLMNNMKPIIKLEDSSLNTLTAKQGYYKVGDKLYHHKSNALIEASRTKQLVNWDFNWYEYSTQSSRPRLNVPLPILYRDRAQRLRDQYDYLILAFSGGADSDNMIKTFLNNNIKIDEVWVDWNISMIEKSGYKLNLSKDASNMPSEWFLVIKPELDKLRIDHPEIKIRVSESLTDLDTPEDNENSFQVSSALLHVNYLKRLNCLRKYVQSISNKTVGVICGVDKIIPYSKNGEYGIIFSDGATANKSPAFEKGDLCLEYFYWSPEVPEIAIEQGHRVWDYLLNNPEFTKIRMNALTNGVDWCDREKVFDGIIKSICYSYWDFSKHQVNKGLYHAGTIFNCLSKFYSERFYQGSESFLNSHYNLIDDRFLNPNYTQSRELKLFFNFHKLGNLPDINV